MSHHVERPFDKRRVFRLPGTGARVRDEVKDELLFHLEGRIEDLVARGYSRDDAEREALRRFGDRSRWQAELEQIDGTTLRRRARGEWLGGVVRDAGYAVRGMIRKPFHALVVVATLALGIGANTAIFSIVDAVLLRPLPAPWLDDMVVVRGSLPSLGLERTQLSPAQSRDLLARTDLFARAASYAGTSFILTGTGDARRVAATQTIGDFFGVLGARPQLGRFYRPEDSDEGRPRVVVLSHGFWTEAFGGDSSVIGRRILLSDVPFEVIGVAPRDLRYPRSAQIWMPFEMTALWRGPERRSSLFFTFAGVRRDDVTAQQLQARLDAEADAWHRQYGSGPSRMLLVAMPMEEFLSGEVRPIVLTLLGAVGLVLLIACANIGSLQLVRAVGRGKELALRAALGAGRGAISRQLLIESLVLATAGGIAGILVGSVALELLRAANVDDFRQLQDVHLSGVALAFTAGVTVLAGLLFGLVPALRASRVDLLDALKETSRGSSAGVSRSRFLHASVVVQVALTLVLLLASTLTIRSLGRLLETDPGFRPEHVVTMRLELPNARYPVTQLSPFFGRYTERLRQYPGFQNVSLTSGLPFSGSGDSSPFEITGMPKGPDEPARHALISVAGPDYFRTMGIELVRGRDFGPEDVKTGRMVAIIDETLAKQYFGNVDPIGKEISQGPDATIVGVVRSVRQSNLDAPLKATVYYDYRQYAWLSAYQIVIRTALPTPAVLREARAALAELDPNLPLHDVKSMDERIAESVGARRIAMSVLSAFAGLSLILALLGIYGVISYRTTQRTQEIGIRMALGANPGQVTKMVLRGGLMLALAGLVAGLLLYLAAGRVLESQLYGVSTGDPLSIAISVIAIAGIATLASALPARRAARLDPNAALRAE